MEKQFVDLLFGEINAERRVNLLTEIEGCADCMGQYQSLSDTLFIAEHTTAAAAVPPPEDYWPRYNASLRERLLAPADVASNARASFWKRLLTANVPVPVPVAAALFIGLVLSSALAFRRAPAAQTMAAPAATSLSIKIIEVPIVQEKFVTRTVYVEKRVATETVQEEPLADVAGASGNGETIVADNKHKEETGFFTRANLKGFQPPEEMKIRVIRRNNTDDK